MTKATPHKQLVGLAVGLVFADSALPALAHGSASPFMPAGTWAHSPSPGPSHNQWSAGQPAQTNAGTTHVQHSFNLSNAHAAASSSIKSPHAYFGLPLPTAYTMQVSPGLLTSQAGSRTIDLDLTSSTATVILGAGLFKHSPSVTVNVGGAQQSFRAGDKVTAAEFVAVQQVLNHANQGIVLNSSGAAIGGTFSLNAESKSNVSSIVIPTAVTAIDYVSRNGVLTLPGDITNYGSIYAVATNSHVTTGSISAADITNAAGATISTLAPSSLVSAVGGALTPTGLNLNLISAGDINNAGVISSKGNITLSTGSGNVINSGLVSSSHGNIQIVSANDAANININAQGGTFQAQYGSINIRDVAYMGSADINLMGGNYLSQCFNMYSGGGAVTGSIGQTTGSVNIDAGAAHLFADTTTLVLGNNNIAGDPTYVSTGDIQINGLVTATESLTFIAQGNIGVTPGSDASITTTGGEATKADITLISGATISAISVADGNPLLPGQTVNVTFTNAHGGNIDLSTGNLHSSGQVIDASLTAGNVTLAANSNGTNTGWISLPTNVASVLTNAEVSGNRGNIVIIAGGTNNSNMAISTSNLQTMGGGGIAITAAQPLATSLVYDSVGNHTGTLTADTTITANAAVTVGLLSASGAHAITPGASGIKGGSIDITAGGAVQTGIIISNGGNGFAGANGITGAAPTNGNPGGDGASGGSISITTQGNISILDILANGGAGGAGGNGGTTINPSGAPAGDGGKGGTGGTGGSITLIAAGSILTNTVTLSGGSAGAGGSGGDHGTAAQAGNGGASGTGGQGGSVTANGGSIGSASNALGIISVNGGSGATAGAGGNSGGGPGTGGDAGTAGTGGSISLTSTNGILNAGPLAAPGGVGGTGGAGGSGASGDVGGHGGAGGKGGVITVTGNDEVDLGDTSSNGGVGGVGGAGTIAVGLGSFGGTGGNGGILQITAGNTLSASTLQANGGTGGTGGGGNATGSATGGTGGDGGDGGKITLAAGNSSTTASITSAAGVGGAGGVMKKAGAQGALGNANFIHITGATTNVGDILVSGGSGGTGEIDISGNSLTAGNILLSGGTGSKISIDVAAVKATSMSIQGSSNANFNIKADTLDCDTILVNGNDGTLNITADTVSSNLIDTSGATGGSAADILISANIVGSALSPISILANGNTGTAGINGIPSAKNGTDGADGGASGNVTIEAHDLFTSGITSNGGAGGNGGAGFPGAGNVNGAGGKGGTGGTIDLTVVNYGIQGSLTSIGGNGGNGGTGSKFSGVIGGNGGAGGQGGTINITMAGSLGETTPLALINTSAGFGGSTSSGTVGVDGASGSGMIEISGTVNIASLVEFGGVIVSSGNLSINFITACTVNSTTSLITSQDISVYSVSASGKNAGNVAFIAGAGITPNPPVGTVTFTDGSTTGGAVIVAGPINTGGGDLLATAYSGTGIGSTSAPGSITISGAINTGSTLTTGVNGDVTLLAGSLKGQAIATGDIITSGLVSGGQAGTVSIIAYSPIINGGTATISAGAVSPTPIFNTSGATTNKANITVGDVIAVGTAGAGGIGNTGAGKAGGAGGDIIIESGGDITTLSLLAFGGGGGGGGTSDGSGLNGGVGGAGGAGGNILVKTASASIAISGYINTSGGGGGGGGGASIAASAGAGGTGGSAGDASIVTSSGDVQIVRTILAAAGGDGGAGNTGGISSGGGGGGSFGGGGGGGAATGQGGGGGGGSGFTSFTVFASGGGGGSTGTNDNPAGGGGGGYTSAGVSAGIGGVGSNASGADGTISGGGDGATASGGTGGLSFIGSGGGGGTTGSPGVAGGNVSSSKSASDGALIFSGTSITLASTASPATAYAGTIKILSASVDPTYLSDADYSSNANTYLPTLTGGSITALGTLVGTGGANAITLNSQSQGSSLSSGTYQGAKLATIIENSSTVNITDLTAVTPAEYIALVQTQSTGSQALILNGSGPGTGVASGGTMTIGAENIPVGNFTNLNLPANVTASVSLPVLIYSGTAVVGGNLNFVGPSAQLNATTVTINGSGTISGNTLAIATTLVNNGGTLAANDLAISNSAGPLAITGVGTWTTPGSLSLSANGNLNVGNLFGTLIVNTHSIALTATNGAITLQTNSLVTTVDGSGNGGTITINANNMSIGNPSLPFILIADADQTGAGKGGSVQVTLNSSGQQTIGTGPSNLQISAAGGKFGGSAGSASVTTGGDLTVDMAGINLTTVSGDGGNLTLIAGKSGTGTLTLNQDIISVNAVGSGNGGGITLAGTTIKTASFSFLTLNATGSDTGNGGNVSFTSSGTNTIFLNTIGGGAAVLAVNANSGANGGNGGSLSVNSGNGVLGYTSANINPQSATADADGATLVLGSQNLITLSVDTVSVNGVGNGNGGTLSLIAPSVVAQPNQVLNANAGTNGYGSGGTIVYSETGFSLKLGDPATVSILNALGGSGGTANNPSFGGSVTVSSAFDLTVPPNRINVSGGGTSGDGGKITLAAGGNLFLPSGLAADFAGAKGKGGSITLISNSKTVMTIGKTKVNGVEGNLSVNGAGGGGNGTVSVTNLGAGGVNLLQNLTAASQITLATRSTSGPVVGNNGSISINANLGSLTTTLITLASSGTGKITQASKFVITSKTLDASSKDSASALSNSTITLPNLSVVNISASTGAKGTVTLTNLTANQINITGGAGGTLTLKSAGNIGTTGNVSVGALTLTTTAKTGGLIDINSNVTSTTGNIALTTAGTILVEQDAAINSFKNVTLTASGTTSNILIGGSVQAGAAGSVTISATKSTTPVAAISAQATSDISAGKTVTLSAPKGGITTGPIGSLLTPTSITVTALGDITNNGNLKAVTSITEKSTSTTGATTITVNGTMQTTSAAKTPTGSIAISVAGAGGTIAASASEMIAAKSVVLTATKGNVTAGGISIITSSTVPATVTITALNNIQTDGVINATSAITLKTTSTSTSVASAITINGNIKAGNVAGTTGTVAITNSGSFGASGILAVSPDISGAKSVTLSATKGAITINNVGVQAQSGAVKITSLGALNVTGAIIAGNTVALSTTSPGTKVGTPTGDISVNSIFTGTNGFTGGAISVVAAGGQLTVGANAQIAANSSKSSTKATITLQNKNSTSAAAGAITINGGAQLITGGAGGKNINIVIGTVPSAAKFGTQPTGAADYSVNGTKGTPTAPPFYFGSGTGSTITINNAGTSDQVQINSVGGGKVIFNTGNLAADRIVINAGTSLSPTIITADPPVPATAASFISSHQPVNTSSALTVAPTSVSVVSPGFAHDKFAVQPASLLTKPQLNIQEVTASPTRLYGSTVENTSMPQSTLIEAVVAPDKDTSIETAFGTVEVGAGCVALIVSQPGGTSVYNLDDRKHDTVAIISKGQRISLAPGRHALVTSHLVERFEMANPVETIAHKNVNGQRFANDFKVFTSEYSIPSCIASVKQLRDMARSQDHKDNQTASHMLKTAAIILQMTSAEPYQYFLHPRMTAVLPAQK